MNDLKKMGGIAALIMAAAYVVGIVLNVTLLDSSSIIDPIEKVAFLMDKQAFMYIWILFIYVIFGIFLVVLALSLYERLKTDSPAMAQTATAFGLIWAGLVIASGLVFNVGLGKVIDLYGSNPTQAATFWLAITSVHEGIGCSIEIPGGLWVLLVSLAALRTNVFSRPLNYLGLAIGVAGLLTVIPAIYDVAIAIFGLSQIVWFVWLGISMLRSHPSAAA